VVARRPASFHYDDAAAVLYVHTSDGKPPAAHGIELVRRGNGIFVSGQSYVSVIGFTFRHTGDAGITFGRSSRGDVAAHNTSYGSHQGIWVIGATDALVYANTLFRNDNSGAYFAGGATGARAIGNTAYENVKGLRWSADSNDGLALDNTIFENSESGLAVESTQGVVARDNRLVRNASQLMVMKGGYESDRNCFESRAGQLTADFVYGERFATLAEYQRAKDQDRGSRAGRCGPLPEKVDVRRLGRAAAR
jgi:nitrous oxidase accessory protein NosD